LHFSLFGRPLSAELSSLLLLVALLGSAVLILGTWRFVHEWWQDRPHDTAVANVKPAPVQVAPADPETPARHGGNKQARKPFTDQKPIAIPEPLPPSTATSGHVSVGPAAAAPIITSFSLAVPQIEQGQSAELSWSVDGAKSVTIEPGLGTQEGGRGKRMVTPAESTTYTLIAVNEGGSVRSTVALTVVPAPVLAISSFEASPQSLTAGQHARLTWKTTGRVSSVSVDPGFNGLEPEGSLDVMPAQTTEYTLHITGPAGTANARAIVKVDQHHVAFTAIPPVIVQGGSTALHWEAPGASQITIEPGSIAANPQSLSTIRVKPLATTTYVLTAAYPPGTETQSVTVVVNRRTGASSGEMVWTGMVHGAQLVTIDLDHADTGTLQGALPGVPCVVQPVDEKHVSVASAPAPRNDFNRLVIRVTGNGMMREVIKWSLQ
jgi:hypothetical protein